MAKATGNSKLWAKVGVWAYIVGLIIALLVSIFSVQQNLAGWAIFTLVVLGIIVGLLNIGDEEVLMFLVASVAFIVAASSMGNIFQGLGPAFAFLARFMDAVVVFTAPGALVVAFKALYHVARDD